MNNEYYDVSVVIGRFSIAHRAHFELFKQALDISDYLMIVVGTANAPLTPKNPFSALTRTEMILDGFSEYGINPERVRIVTQEDRSYNLQGWLAEVQSNVADKIAKTINLPWKDKGADIVLVGHKKDNSSFYLDSFPQWDKFEIDNIDDINSTQIRRDMFKNRFVSLKVPKPIRRTLIDWMDTEDYEYLLEEFNFIEKYKEAWEIAPYAPTFITTDAVVIQSGHILLIKRRASPGKGLYALPGGFLEQEETLETGMLRELKEETKLKVPSKILQGSITKRDVFDDPSRSLRGRTITYAFLIELPNGQLSEIKASSDAEKVKWFPISEVLTMREKLYEDHLDIILKMIGDM